MASNISLTSTIPDEILLQILHHVGEDEGSLLNFALTCRRLRSVGLDVLESVNLRNTASGLRWACANGNMNVAKRMFGHSLDPNFCFDADGMHRIHYSIRECLHTPIAVAAYWHQAEIVRYLASRGADMDNIGDDKRGRGLKMIFFRDAITCQSPPRLHRPIHYALMGELEDRGARGLAVGARGYHSKGLHDTINALIDCGADVNCRMKEEDWWNDRYLESQLDTPLDLAVIAQWIPAETVQLLIDRGAFPASALPATSTGPLEKLVLRISHLHGPLDWIQPASSVDFQKLEMLLAASAEYCRRYPMYHEKNPMEYGSGIPSSLPIHYMSLNQVVDGFIAHKIRVGSRSSMVRITNGWAWEMAHPPGENFGGTFLQAFDKFVTTAVDSGLVFTDEISHVTIKHRLLEGAITIMDTGCPMHMCHFLPEIPQSTLLDACGCHSHESKLFRSRNLGLILVKFLVENGADVHEKDSFDGLTALSWAIQEGLIEVAEYLRQHGCR